MSSAVEMAGWTDGGALPAPDMLAARLVARAFTGDRRRDREAFFSTMDAAGVTTLHMLSSILEALQSGNLAAAAAARSDLLKILGMYAPMQVEESGNRYVGVGYDEVRVRVMEGLEGEGVLPVGTAGAYRESISGLVRVGGLLLRRGDG